MIDMKNKFDLFGAEYAIKHVKDIEKNSKDEEMECCYGLSNSVRKEITIADEVDGVKISDDEKRLTLLHELMHVIFIEGAYNSCTNDEPLVEWCAKCLNSLIKQKVI